MTAAARKPNPVRAGLIGKLHVAKAQLGLDDDTYRGVLRRITGKESSSQCSITELENVKAEFVNLGWTPARKAHPRAGNRPLADGETAAKLRALWISGYHLGVVKDPTEAALATFVKRVTGGKKRGVDALQWMTDNDARKAIEAAKAMLTREAGVDWSVKWHEGDRGAFPRRDVVRAQYKILHGVELVGSFALGRFLSNLGFGPVLSLYDDADMDRLIEKLGAMVRAAKDGR
ncbi:gp16 family protein [Dongia sp.]|uniref:gp16 family protein n=1 Tax=Dongia sp. TaxID=1977262 RepID=UPI0035B0D3FB